MFHVKHGGMAELWGRQFEKYHFSPTRYRGVSVSRETWVRDVLGLGRRVYGKLGCFVLFGSLFSYWENPSTTTGGKSERKCYLACLSLLTETSHVWRR